MSEEKVIKRRKRERKITEIETALRIGDLVALRKLAAEEYGLVEGMLSFGIPAYTYKWNNWVLDRLRRTCWPLLLQIDSNNYPPLGNRQQLRQSRHAGQVKLDVDRSIKRFPEKMPEAQRLILQEVCLESLRMLSNQLQIFSNWWIWFCGF